MCANPTENKWLMICLGRVDLRMPEGMCLAWGLCHSDIHLCIFPEFCTIFQFSLFSRVTCEWQVVKKKKKKTPPTLPFTHFFPVSSDQWKDGSETQISFSVCHVVVLYKQYVWRLHIFQLGILQTHFFPACAAQSSKSKSLVQTLTLFWSYYWDKRCLFSSFHSCCLHTNTHTNPSLFSYCTVCSQGKWGHPGVRSPGYSKINTVHACQRQSALLTVISVAIGKSYASCMLGHLLKYLEAWVASLHYKLEGCSPNIYFGEKILNSPGSTPLWDKQRGKNQRS